MLVLSIEFDSNASHRRAYYSSIIYCQVLFTESYTHLWIMIVSRTPCDAAALQNLFRFARGSSGQKTCSVSEEFPFGVVQFLDAIRKTTKIGDVLFPDRPFILFL